MNKLINLYSVFFVLFAIIACQSVGNNIDYSDNLTQIQIDSLKRIECDSILNKLVEGKLDTIESINRIPNTFDESLVYLDTLINDEFKKWIACLPDKEFSAYVHLHLGMYLRNNWKLWGGSQLANDFNEMGVYHPDDMSGIILNSYQRRVKGEPIRLEEQVKHYQDFWEKSQTKDSLKNQKN